MIDEKKVERRLATLEQAVAGLQNRLATVSSSKDWLEKITGSITDEEAFQEALEYGRAFRYADRPADDNGEHP